MRHRVLFCLGSVALAFKVAAQTAVDVTRPEEQQKARQAVVKEQESARNRRASLNFAVSKRSRKRICAPL